MDQSVARIHELYARVDAHEMEALGTLLAPDARFQFNAGAEVEGVNAIIQHVETLQASHAALTHSVHDVFYDADRGVGTAELTAHYTLTDGQRVDLHSANVLRLDGEQIISWRVYADTAAMTAAQTRLRAAAEQSGTHGG